MPDEDSLRHKYTPLPEEPRHRKKAKKRHMRSDHKHEYEKVCIDAHTHLLRRGERLHVYHIGKRCKVCGRLGEARLVTDVCEPPAGMPLYEVGNFFDFVVMKELPESMKVRD